MMTGFTSYFVAFLSDQGNAEFKQSIIAELENNIWHIRSLGDFKIMTSRLQKLINLLFLKCYLLKVLALEIDHISFMVLVLKTLFMKGSLFFFFFLNSSSLKFITLNSRPVSFCNFAMILCNSKTECVPTAKRSMSLDESILLLAYEPNKCASLRPLTFPNRSFSFFSMP